MFSALGQGREHQGDDQFGSDQLAEGELTVDDEPAAQAEQEGAPHGLQINHEEVLPPEDPEVILACPDVVRAQGACPVEGQALHRSGAEEGGRPGDLPDPSGEVELGIALLDAGGDGAGSEGEGHHDHRNDEDDGVGEKVGVVAGEQDETHQRDHDHADPFDQKPRQGLLHRADLEEPVCQIAGVAPLVGGGFGPREIRRELVRIADEEAALEILRQEDLKALHRGRDQEQGQHHQSQGDHRPEQDAEGDRVHQRLDGRRSRDREQADGKREDQDHPHILGIEIEGFPEAFQGAFVGVVACVGHVRRNEEPTAAGVFDPLDGI